MLIGGGQESARARVRLLGAAGGPGGGELLRADWTGVLFVHYAVPGWVLAGRVPFELDLFGGEAYVSLVAFTMGRLRLARGGRWTGWVTAPVRGHELLNVRTYVRHGGERGIYFLKEWVPHRLAAYLGPRTYGLPYRLGRLDYRHRPGEDEMGGRVEAAGLGGFEYRAQIGLYRNYQPAVEGGRGDFLLERYTAFTRRGRVRRRFRVWHPPWRQVEVGVEVLDDGLLRATEPWLRHARPAGAHYSPGVDDVSLGWPERLGPRVWIGA